MEQERKTPPMSHEEAIDVYREYAQQEYKSDKERILAYNRLHLPGFRGWKGGRIYQKEDDMKYQVGQKIKYVNKDYWFLKNHYGAVGIVVDYRRYCEKYPTHYVVKWDCYTIPHIYNRCDIEKCCEPVGEVAAEDVQTIDNVVKIRTGEEGFDALQDYPL